MLPHLTVKYKPRPGFCFLPFAWPFVLDLSISHISYLLSMYEGFVAELLEARTREDAAAGVAWFAWNSGVENKPRKEGLARFNGINTGYSE
jgi:hypothetical protein